MAALFELIARTKRSVVCSAFADTLMRQSRKSGTNNYAKKNAAVGVSRHHARYIPG